MRLCQFEGYAEAVNGGGEATEEELLLGPGEDLVQPRPHRPFAGGVSGTVNVSRILQQSQPAALTVFREGMQVECLAVRGREVDFEVTGVHDHAHRGLDRQRDTINQAVSDPNGLDGKGAQVKLLPRRNLDQLCGVEQAVLFELAFDIGEGELGGVDGNLQFAQNPGQATDMVLVTMRQDNGANMLAVLDEVGD